MKCDECLTNDSTFDERMGEHICNGCGLVIVTEMFEETVHILDRDGTLNHSADKGKLGSVITGAGSYKLNRRNYSVIPAHIQNALMHCNMVLANFSPSEELKQRVEKIYMEAYRKNVFGKHPFEERATAVVFYALKENGTPLPLKEVISEFEVNAKKVRQIVRKLNVLYQNQINFAEVNPAYHLEYCYNKIVAETGAEDRLFLRQCLEVLARFENITSNSNYTKSKSYYATLCWITANVFNRREYSRNLIAKANGYNTKCIYNQTKSLLSLVGLEKVAELKGKDVNKIGETNV